MSSVTITTDQLSKACWRILGAERWAQLMDEHFGTSEAMALETFPTAKEVRLRLWDEDNNYVDGYILIFDRDDDAVMCRMLA